MRAIYKRDLRGFFVSPLGYVYIAAFFIITTLNFLLNNVNGGYSDLSNTFSYMLTVLMFTTPILTMRLFSEEYKQKTDQLLLTAPVRVVDIVIGKFLAALTLFLCVLALALCWPLIVAIFGATNVAAIIGHYVALLCAASAFIAIGLFMSSLTENQLISALSTLGILFALFLLDIAAANFNTVFLSKIAKVIGWLSLYRRYDLFTRGIFSLADLVFYVSVCVFFLFLSARVLEKKRWS